MRATRRCGRRRLSSTMAGSARVQQLRQRAVAATPSLVSAVLLFAALILVAATATADAKKTRQHSVGCAWLALVVVGSRCRCRAPSSVANHPMIAVALQCPEGRRKLGACAFHEIDLDEDGLVELEEVKEAAGAYVNNMMEKIALQLVLSPCSTILRLRARCR